MMDLGWGTLANIDRKLLSGLGRGESYRMVRLPVSDAVWSTWKRFCSAAGIPMGRAIALLIDRELVGVVGDVTGDESPMLAQRVADQLTIREAKIAARERDVDAAEARMREESERFQRREDELEVREQRVETVAKLRSLRPAARAKIGRNERCPCGSGLKYKHCHGLPGR